RLQGLNAVELRFSPDNAGSEIECWRRENWTCRPQGAGPLGQRLRSAFEQAFSSGASRVAIIGSDCPAVTVQDIDEAWKSLRTHDVVLGPASDGGYWLIGSNRPLPQLFEDIAWSTEKVFAETIARVRRGGLSVRILRELSDVETARAIGAEVIDRNNLTIIEESGYGWLPEYLAAHEVQVIASLPCYSAENVNQQRGHGVFEKSILALKKLNAAGYGTKLPLHL